MGQTPLSNAFEVGEVLFFRKLSAVAFVLTAALGLAAPTAAETAAEFYKGKVVKLVVGYGPGGGYDTYARMLAPHLEERLDATVVVENRPGGGGMVVLNQLATSTDDGVTLVLANLEAAALGQILGSPGIRFDLAALPVLGRVSGEPKVLMVGNESPFRSLADLQSASRPIKWAGGGKTDGIADLAAVVSQAMDLNSKIIIGYKGAKESALAAIRGEVDGLFASAGTARKLVQKGQLIAVAVIDRKRTEFLPEVPTIFELADLSEEKAWWIDYRSDLSALGRTLVAGSNTSADKVSYLRGVIAKILTDPDVVAEADSKKRPLAFAPYSETEAVVQQTVAVVDRQNVERLREVILNKYY